MALFSFLKPNVFKTWQKVLDEMELHYDVDNEKKRIYLEVGDDNDYLIKLVMWVDEKRELAIVCSFLDLEVSVDYEEDVAQACSIINYNLAQGGFDFDCQDGSVTFRVASTYKGMTITKEVLKKLLLCAYFCTKDYNDVIHKVANGQMTLDEVVQVVEGDE